MMDSVDRPLYSNSIDSCCSKTGIPPEALDDIQLPPYPESVSELLVSIQSSIILCIPRCRMSIYRKGAG